MDELIQHCLQSLSFDGDLGCNSSRLRDFMEEFYSFRTSNQQVLDDSYHAYVWYLIAQQPSVTIGTIPEGQNSEVFIPAQPRVKKKGKDIQDEIRQEPTIATKLNVIPNAKTLSLSDLEKTYGQRLRIAVDPETCFVAITGSHSRSPKLTPMVYASLQLISRAREEGLSVMALGKATGYDQKTCFYIVKQLLELNLVVKLRRGGNSMNFCIHKYFFDRSPIWKAIRDEEQKGQELLNKPQEADNGLTFDPIDVRHLTTLNILRQRLTMLLKNSEDECQPYQNICLKIGFRPRSRTDRRFFIARLNELISEGTIEKFYISSKDPNALQNRLFIRLRYQNQTSDPPVFDDSLIKLPENEEEMIDALTLEDTSVRVQSTLTLHRQVIDLVQSSRASGITLNDISDRLDSCEKRILELITTRAERQTIPPHLSDYKVIQLLETYGRERRYRFFTLEGYSELAARDNLGDPENLQYNKSEAGNFAAIRKQDFYTSREELLHFLDKFSNSKSTLGVSGRTLGKSKRMEMIQDDQGLELASVSAVGPVLPVKRKRGRPRKNPIDTETENVGEHIRKGEVLPDREPKRTKYALMSDTASVVPVEEGQGHSKRKRKVSSGANSEPIAVSSAVAQSADAGSQNPNPSTIVPQARKRGRPPKKQKNDSHQNSHSLGVGNEANHVDPVIPSSSIYPSTEPPFNADHTYLSHRPIPFPPSDENVIPSGTFFNSGSIFDAVSQEQTNLIKDSDIMLAYTDPLIENSVSVSGLSSGFGGVLYSISDDQEQPLTLHTTNNEPVPVNPDLQQSKDTVSASTSADLTSNPTPGQNGDEPMSPHNIVENNETRPSRGRTNLTAMRRENEMIKLLEDAGGIINTSTNEFVSTFMNLVESIVKSGAVASAPIGTRMDRRTLTYTLENLEAKGRIKTINTNIQYYTGPRKSKLIYLPTISDEKLKAYISQENFSLNQMGKQENMRQMAETSMELDPDSSVSKALRWLCRPDSHENYHERWHRNESRIQDLFLHGDDVIHEALLLEKQTLSQTYGFITGKAMRARKIHMHMSSIFLQENTSSLVVSREKRVIAAAYFERDLPLSIYCSCVSSIAYKEDIRIALDNEGERDRPVGGIPDDWKLALGVGNSRSRSRIIDLLEYLRSLKIVSPLQVTTSTGPNSFICEDHGNHPSSFKPAPSDWSTRTPVVHPIYWQFNTSAPMYLLAIQEDPLPYRKDVRVSSEDEVATFWDELKPASLDKEFAMNMKDKDTTGEVSSSQIDHRVLVSMRRASSWDSDYTFSWYQTQYLKKYVDDITGATPIQDADKGVQRMKKISYVISAPFEAVKRYYVMQGEIQLGNIKRVHRIKEQLRATKQRTEKNISLAKKGAEAVQNRERAWDTILKKVHPEPLGNVAASRLRKLRQSYVLGRVIQDNKHWEVQIAEAVRGAEKCRASRKLFKSSEQKDVSLTRNLVATNARGVRNHVSALEDLIDIQRNMFLEKTHLGIADGTTDNENRPRRKKAEDGSKGGRARRQRFQWNADFDELARDASVIIRSRCRYQKRLDWGALAQVFPNIPRNTVRLRIQTLREQPAAEAYLYRLENRWHDLWMRKRSTDELPDENPLDPTGFNLKIHLEYLRKNIDKNAIRIGISTEPEREHVILPSNLNDLIEQFDINERDHGTTWEFVFNTSYGEESREKMLLDSSFVMETELMTKNDFISDPQSIAESALKMVIGTPNETYDVDLAASFLHDIGEEDISAAQENLLSRNVLSKLIRGPTRLIPGRTVKISDINQYALGGPLSEDVFQDATQLLESYAIEQDVWHNWPLTSSDGDTVALLQMISENKVGVQFDTAHIQGTRASVEGNSRKVDDDDIEPYIRVRIRDLKISDKPVHNPVNELPSIEIHPEGHYLTVSGARASCGRFSNDVVDCLKCIEDAHRKVDQESWSQLEKYTAHSIIQHADSREAIGIETEELKNLLANTCDVLTFTKVLHSLHTYHTPLCYLTGYSRSIVLSAKHIRKWTVALPIPDSPLTRIFPRRWLDISGDRVPEVWNAALRAVSGIIHLRPGISQAELRWRLGTVYDRQEIFELVNHLHLQKKIKLCRYSQFQPETILCLEALSENEEKSLFWISEEKERWFQLS